MADKLANLDVVDILRMYEKLDNEFIWTPVSSVISITQISTEQKLSKATLNLRNNSSKSGYLKSTKL